MSTECLDKKVNIDNIDNVLKKERVKKARKDPDFSRPHVLTKGHEETYQKQRSMMASIKSLVNSTSYNNKLSVISEHIDFVRSFTTKGVQGVVGFVVIKSDKSGSKKETDPNDPKTESKKETPIVFKLSTDVNRSVEHEYEIMEYFNDMRKYCPHFSRSIEMINIPVSNDFIFD